MTASHPPFSKAIAMNELPSRFPLAFLREASFVGGEWIAADSGRTFSVGNPATGEAVGSVPDCGRAETARAIAAARAALPAWRARTAKERAGLLHRLADIIDREAPALATLLTVEQGKSLTEATGEIRFSASYVRWFAEEAQRVYGDVIPSPWAGRRILVTRGPVGVVGAITPWNFPSSMIARKLAPALAAGCTIVIKPAELTPFSGLAWGVLGEEAGIPAGVINILTGSPKAIGAELTENPHVAKITFTGSTPVGKTLVAQCAPSLKRVSMELGGNAPFIVFDDADVDEAVEGALIAKMRNIGEACTSANRFHVHASLAEEFTRKLADRMGAMRVGRGTDDGTEVGPLINEDQRSKVDELVQDAVGKGARLLTGGKAVDGAGYFYEPTVLASVPADARLLDEEIFGPVAPVTTFETDEEAIAAANDTEYGLVAYVFTKDLTRAFKVCEALETGMIGLNQGLVSNAGAPFGGVKASGYGREGGPEGLHEYLETKYIALNV